jgi:uncharacterized membrane protein YdjX (TVP38/TMEM64 family)
MTLLENQTDTPIRWWRPVALLVAITLMIVLAQLFGVRERLGSLREWIASLGAWGPVAFILIYTAAVVVALPGSLLTLAGGALFGVVNGVALVSIASTLGASIDFLIARYLAREPISRWLGRKEMYQRLEKLTRDRGAVIIALTRLVPLFPFNLLNYGFGLTAVRFRTYVFWSWLCMLPGTVLYVAGSDAIFSGLTHGRVPWNLLLLILPVAGLLAVLVPIARRKLSAPGAAGQIQEKEGK